MPGRRRRSSWIRSAASGSSAARRGRPRRCCTSGRAAPWAHRRRAARVHRGAGVPAVGQAPRDLPGGSAARGTGEAQDHRASARRPPAGLRGPIRREVGAGPFLPVFAAGRTAPVRGPRTAGSRRTRRIPSAREHPGPEPRPAGGATRRADGRRRRRHRPGSAVARRGAAGARIGGRCRLPGRRRPVPSSRPGATAGAVAQEAGPTV